MRTKIDDERGTVLDGIVKQNQIEPERMPHEIQLSIRRDMLFWILKIIFSCINATVVGKRRDFMAQQTAIDKTSYSSEISHMPFYSKSGISFDLTVSKGRLVR